MKTLATWPALCAGLILTGPALADGGNASPTADSPTTVAADPTETGPDKSTTARPAAPPPGPMAIPEIFPDPARFVVIKLHEEVSLGMAAYVGRVAADLETGDVLVLDINTFGGRVDAAVSIRDTLLSLREREIPAVAYVHPRAISAGALISLATDVIVVAPGATIGAATPIRVGGGGKAEPVEEKTVSYMRKEMRATAEARGRNGDLAEAMVDADVEVAGLIESGKLLTLDGNQALAWGVASGEAATFADLVASLDYGPGKKAHTVREVSWSWAEKLAGFLTSSVLSGLLMSIGMLGLMIGLYTGGNPLPLAVGAVCLGIFFFGHHVVDLAGLEEVILFALGVGLILFEAFVPGHILPGVIGVLLVIASLLMGLVNLEQVPFSVQWQDGFILRALGTVFAAIAGTAVLGIAAFHVLPNTGFGRKLVLEAAIDARSTDPADEHNREVVGQRGLAVTDLHPSGKVEIAGKRHDAVAERGYVAAGAAVEVVATHGFSIVVTEIPDDPEKAEKTPEETT